VEDEEREQAVINRMMACFGGSAKTMWFSVDTCGFDGTIVVDF
jgi:hypothetical protein